jgi:RNA polymerase sigma-70 factor, ECF subfamily
VLTHDMLANQRTTGGADGGTAAAARAAPGPDRLLTAVAERQDHLAFAQLFERFAPRIEAWLRRRGASVPLAEDVAQDVMLALWQRAAQFDSTRATASTWIFAIARNRLIDSYRRGRGEPTLDAESIVGAADDDTEHSFYLTELERHLRHAVASLPSDQNRLIAQGYFAEKSQSTLADELDLPLGTVKSRQRLALGKLRRLLDHVL